MLDPRCLNSASPEEKQRRKPHAGAMQVSDGCTGADNL
jgi:hypothetical protein